MLASALAFERFLGLFFFFFFCATVASSSTRDEAESSRGEGEAEVVELVRDGLIEDACSRSLKFSIERFSIAMFAMRVRMIDDLTTRQRR